MLNIYDAIREVHEQNLSLAQKYVQYREVLRQSWYALLQTETIRLSDDFSKLTFLTKRQNLSNTERFGLWNMWKRPDAIASGQFQPTDSNYLSDLKAMVWGSAKLTQTAIPTDFKELLSAVPFPLGRSRPRSKRVPRIRAIFQSYHTIGGQIILYCEDFDNPSEQPIQVRLSKADENWAFSDQIPHFWPGASLYLVDVLLPIDDPDMVVPRFVVLEPDYLVNASDLAETYTGYGDTPLYYLMKKLEPVPNKKAIILGNVANFFLDELLNEASDQRLHFLYKDTQTGKHSGLFVKSFSQQPFQFSTCTELETTEDFQSYREEAEAVYRNLRDVISKDFPRSIVQIDPEKVIIEPAFLSVDYGVQGRLDMLQRREGNAKVVELKSGKPPFPSGNLSLIKPNHESQLLLYRLMLQSASEDEVDSRYQYKFNQIDIFLLYAGAAQGRLRAHSPLLHDSQRVMNQRNRLIVQEYQLANDHDSSRTRQLIESIGPDTLITHDVHPNFRAILEPQHQSFRDRFSTISSLQRSYIYSFISFISAELFLAKTGGGLPGRASQANLWRDDLPAKLENGTILFDLFITKDNSTTPAKELVFSIPSYEQNYLPNFRKGDVCMLYERNSEKDSVLRKQVFKCTISHIDAKQVRIRLRYQQRHTEVFKPLSRWALEPDTMDTVYVAMYKGLYLFAGAPAHYRSKLLTQTEPARYTAQPYANPLLSDHQNTMIANALSSPDYYLVIGPPGTGKTRVMLANLVTELYRQPSQNILLVAYTNRAVDEICEAVTKAIGASNFVRIGSELSCEEIYRENLLDRIAGNTQTRAELKEQLTARRVFIATLASLAGCMELFELKQFNIAIVDEASQILEPQLIGLLTKVQKFILIGDQKQLPAIVLQNPDQAKIPTSNAGLHHIGLTSRNESYFERLLRRCKDNGWTWAYGLLDTQGRMHEELALFPNISFYGGQLKTRADDPDQPTRFGPLSLKPTSPHDPLDQLLASRRLLFFPSEASDTAKLNDNEARMAAVLVERIINLYAYNGLPFDPKLTVGIITPYRRQIALVRKYLREGNISYAEQISVDTVERYQGSQRDIIIYTFAVNSSRQIEYLRNDYYDGGVRIDRKLNVASTRTRQQIIYLATESVLAVDNLFYRLFEFVKSKDGYVSEGVAGALAGNIRFIDPSTDQSVATKHYSPAAGFKSAFRQIVIDPIQYMSISWPNDYAGFSVDVCRNIIVEFGRANFSEAIMAPTLTRELKPVTAAERVQMYCFLNMRKHYFTTYSIFDSYSDYFYQALQNTSFRVAFVDIGCGPMTAGLAFQEFLCTLTPNFGFQYFGIDKAPSMLMQAKAFSKSGLFSSGQKNWFGTSINQLPEEWLSDSFKVPNTVIISTCYLFGNLTIDDAEALAVQINQLIEKFPMNKYILIHQNPKSDQRNRAFFAFRKMLRSLSKQVASKTETVGYSNNSMSQYDKIEEVHYTILSN